MKKRCIWVYVALFWIVGCNPAPVDGICDVPMEPVLHKEGNHHATPSYLYGNNLDFAYQVFEWQVQFSGSCLDPSQSPHPWNKITGVTWNNALQGANNNAFMFAWRPNLENSAIEICPYFHKNDGERFHAAFPGGLYPEIPIIQTPIDFCTDLVLIVDKINSQAQFQVNGEVYTAVFAEYGYFDLGGNARYVNPWYGGPDPAPTDISYLLGFN